MGSLFLFISLAVLVGIVGLLAYYFKSRLAEVESKNLKSLEIIEGIYSQQQQLKQYVLNGATQAQAQHTQAQHTQAQAQHTQAQHTQAQHTHDPDQYDERIKIVLEENDESESESESEYEYESESESDVKMITVDMSFPEECLLDYIEEEGNEYIPEDEPEVQIDNQPVEINKIVVNKLNENNKDEDLNATNEDLNATNEDLNATNEDLEITAVKSNEKDTYKKMSVSALKNILYNRGIITDSIHMNKMKKSEIIDLLLVASLAQ